MEGRLDESARRLSHPEFAVARQLTSEGHQVYALPERPGRARTADLLVCGTPVEVKSWLGQDQRSQVPGTRSVVNKLRQAEGQAATVILEGRGSGLTSVAAHKGMAMYAGLPHRGPVAAVRVLGDGFDLAWTRSVPSRSPPRRRAPYPGPRPWPAPPGRGPGAVARRIRASLREAALVTGPGGALMRISRLPTGRGTWPRCWRARMPQPGLPASPPGFPPAIARARHRARPHSTSPSCRPLWLTRRGRAPPTRLRPPSGAITAWPSGPRQIPTTSRSGSVGTESMPSSCRRSSRSWRASAWWWSSRFPTGSGPVPRVSQPCTSTMSGCGSSRRTARRLCVSFLICTAPGWSRPWRPWLEARRRSTLSTGW